MRIAVVQHELRDTPNADAGGLTGAATKTCALEADLVIFPDIPSLRIGAPGEAWRSRTSALLAPAVSWFVAGPSGEAISAVVDPVPEAAPLGRFVLLAGDAAIEPANLARVAAAPPDALVLAPGSESELQAQAVLELAVRLSLSAASVVVVCEASGAEVGEPGHGSSAIIVLGEVMAEAIEPTEVICAEVPVPLGPPEPRGPLPELPPLLAMRLAAHQGRIVEPGYPADLT